MHHVAYEVDDVGAALSELEAAGRAADRRDSRDPGLFGLQVAFVHPDAVHGVLTEVVCPWLTDSIRIELAFEGGQIIAAMVSPATADSVERAVTAGAGGTARARHGRRAHHGRRAPRRLLQALHEGRAAGLPRVEQVTRTRGWRCAAFRRTRRTPAGCRASRPGSVASVVVGEPDCDERLDDVTDRSGRVDLVRAGCPQASAPPSRDGR